MIKCEKSSIALEDVKKAYEQQVMSKYQQPIDPFYVQRYGISASQIRENLFKNVNLKELRDQYTGVVETWVNPNKILKIDKCTNTLVNETFLRITLENGETLDVKGNSIQEFMLKNIVLGDDVG